MSVTIDMIKVREWAKETGHPVGVRGPIAMPVIVAYLNSQGADNVQA